KPRRVARADTIHRYISTALACRQSNLRMPALYAAIEAVYRLHQFRYVLDTPQLLAHHAVQEWLYSDRVTLTPIVQGDVRARLEERISHALIHARTVATLAER